MAHGIPRRHASRSSAWAHIATALAIGASQTAFPEGVLCLQRDVAGSASAPSLAIKVVGDRAYLAGGSFGGLSIFDISDPTSPAMLGEYISPNVALNVDVAGDTAYLADGSHLRILNVSDPTAPTLLSSYPTTSALRSVTVVGDVGYLCQFQSLGIVSLANPGSPVSLGTLATPGNNIWAADVVRSLAYLADGAGALHIVDVSNPAAPSILGSVAVEGIAYAVKVVDDVAHVVTSTSLFTGGRLHLIDVAVPDAPKPISTLWLPAEGTGIDVVKDVAYIACGEGGLQLVDVSDRSSPAVGANYMVNANVRDVQVSEQHAYLASGGVTVVDVSTSESPVVASLALDGPAVQMVSGARHAYLRTADGATLHVIDPADPRRPQILGSFQARQPIGDIAASGSIVVLSEESGAVLLIDAADPAQPMQVGSLPIAGVSAVAIDGSLVVALDGPPDESSSLLLFDVSEPSSPVLLATMERAFEEGRDVALAGGFAYVGSSDGLHIVDVAQASEPSLLGFAEIGSAWRVLVDGERAYVHSSTCETWWCSVSNKVVDVANPSEPVQIGIAGFGSIAVDGSRLIDSNGLYRLQILDAADPPEIVHLASYGGPYGASLAVRGQFAWVGTASGLEILDIGDCPISSSPADLNGDGVVNAVDLSLLLGSWGTCPRCAADLDADGEVGSVDLALLLGAWT